MRFVAATNQHLEDRVREGTFRRDLYYRLAVLSIPVPPLRERRTDIPVMARHLLMRLAREMGRARCHFEEDALDALVGYSWPGNGRELRNVIERAVMLAADQTIKASDVRALLPQGDTDPIPDTQGFTSLPYADAKEQAIGAFTKAYLRAKLSQCSGVITKAAESSGIPRQHFSLLMKRFLGTEGVEDA